VCDAALWLDAGRTRLIGPTEMVLAAYETHVRLLDAKQPAPGTAASPAAAAPRAIGPGQRGVIRDLTIGPLAGDAPATLQGNALEVTVIAETAGDEQPNVAVMLEQVGGVGITSVATHVDGVQVSRQPDGSWRAVVTFPDLPLHSGEYVVSAYLFDGQGIIVYDEWYQHARFLYASPARLPGLVSLRHHWS
jgi:lipopolysaccharide transport system ATP-binding protein